MKSAFTDDTTASSRAKGWLLVLLALLVGALIVLCNLPAQRQIRDHVRMAAGEASRRMLRPPAHPTPYQVETPPGGDSAAQ